VKSHLAVAAVLVAALAAPIAAQEQKPVAAASAPVTLKIQLVLARYQGEKKISSLPYTLNLVPDERNRNMGRANVRLGTQVPITTMSRAAGGDNNAPLIPTVNYRDVGTNIDCFVYVLDDGRYKVDLTIEDSSVDTGPGTSASTANPTLRSFRTNASLLLRDGQSAQHSTATDKVSGDVWKVDVTLNVVK